MFQIKRVFIFLILITAAFAIQAQQFNSVPLEHDAYKLIEMGILRGMISSPPAARPWSEAIIKEKLRQMQDDPADNLSPAELDIVSDTLASFDRKKGIDFRAGRFTTENTVANHKFTLEAGLNWDSNFSIQAPQAAIASVNRGTFYTGGDMGNHLSWDFTISGGFLEIDRELLGRREDPPYIDPKNGDYDGNPNSDGHHYYYNIPAPSTSPVYSFPAYFPYTFTRPWEGGVFMPDDLAGYASWPETFAFFYEMFGELNASFFDNRLYMRLGRHRRDWGPEENGSSLFLNATARPLMAFEGTAVPFPWLRLSFMTGTLEYLNDGNQWSNAEPFQNLLSMALLEFDTGKHFHFDFGSSAIYAKRLELGYMAPLTSNFFYQNNIGDFDNLAMVGNIALRFSGLKIWASAFVDEMRPTIGSFFTLDRNMYAYQGGIKARISWLPFGALTLRYTKVEPYCYTHEYTENPWNSSPVDTAYLNNGENLGFYLPPNSDELLIRMETMPLRELKGHVQYQLIRHGADWGYRRVDGSSIRDKIVKDDNSEKYFLRDGAYQWDHVLKIGASYSLKTRDIPISFYSEAGLVITRFTDSDAELGSEGNYSPIDNAVYRAGTGFIFSLGLRIFP